MRGGSREKREKLTGRFEEEEEKAKIQRDLSILTDHLLPSMSFGTKIQARKSTIEPFRTQGCLYEDLKSSQTLLQVLKRETVNLVKKKQSSH